MGRGWGAIFVVSAGLFFVFFVGCGKSASTLGGVDNGPAPIAPDALPGVGSEAEQAAAASLPGNLTQNLAACAADGTIPNAQSALSSLLSAFDLGDNGTPRSAKKKKRAAENCASYASQAAQDLGTLNDRGLFAPGALRAWIQKLVRWAYDEGRSSVPPSPTRIPSQPSIIAVFASANEGDHLVGGRACPAGAVSIGNIADCGGGQCNGNQTFCLIPGAARPDESETPVNTLVDFSVTPEGAHVVGGPACPSGSQAVSNAADCGGGECNGNQLLCAKYQLSTGLHRGDRIVKSIAITGEGLHAVGGPGCPANHQVVGNFADCGGGQCNGNQLVCVSYGTL